MHHCVYETKRYWINISIIFYRLYHFSAVCHECYLAVSTVARNLQVLLERLSDDSYYTNDTSECENQSKHTPSPRVIIYTTDFLQLPNLLEIYNLPQFIYTLYTQYELQVNRLFYISYRIHSKSKQSRKFKTTAIMQL